MSANHVPRRWTVSPADPVALDAPLDRLPIICTMAAGFGVQVLGIAHCAIETLRALTKTKVSPDPGPGLGERPAVLASIALHGAAVVSARAHLRACVTALWDSVTPERRRSTASRPCGRLRTTP